MSSSRVKLNESYGAVDAKWRNDTSEGQEVFNFAERARGLGLLDSAPAVVDGMESLGVKVACKGAAGSGKTCTALRLSGHLPEPQYMATRGLQVFESFWPIKVDKGRTYLLQYQFWDAGAESCMAHEYVREELGYDSDVLLYVVSVTDFKSFRYAEKLLEHDKDLPAIKVIVACKCDLVVKREVSDDDLLALHKKFDVAIVRLGHFPVTDLEYFEQPDVYAAMEMISISAVRRANRAQRNAR